MIYVDTSAVAKLLRLEDETDAVRSLFESGVRLVSSRLLEVELHSIAARQWYDHAAVDALIDRVATVSLGDDITQIALDLRSSLRTLDTLHLATAVLLADELTAFLCFDVELTRAARDRGIPLHPLSEA